MLNFIHENFPKEIFEKEINFALKKIKECPNNESVFNYIRGLFDIKDNEGNKMFKFSEFSELRNSLEKISAEEKKNFYCLGLQLDVEVEYCKENENKNKEKSLEIFDKLIEADFIRRKYWKWRKQNFNENLN